MVNNKCINGFSLSFIEITEKSIENGQKKLSIDFRDIDGQIILISEWTRDTAGHTQPKVVV